MKDDRTWWQKLKWKLFGEIKIFYWLFGLVSLIGVVIVISIVYSAIHFISKYW